MNQTGLASVYRCKFKFRVEEAEMVIKFPCQIYVQWKQQSNNENSVGTAQRVKLNNGIATFNETLYFQSQINFNEQTLKFKQKQTTIFVNLVSKSKPDSVKQVGRVQVDLGSICNGQSPFIQLNSKQLEYCPMKATITFSINLQEKHQSNRTISQIDREYLNEHKFVYPKSKKITIETRLKSQNQGQQVPNNINIQSNQSELINLQKKQQQQLPNNVQLGQGQNVDIREQIVYDIKLGKQNLIVQNKQQEKKVVVENVEQVVEVIQIKDVKQILKNSPIQHIISEEKIILEPNNYNNLQKQNYHQNSKSQGQNLEKQTIIKNDRQIQIGYTNNQQQNVNVQPQSTNQQYLKQEKLNELEIENNQRYKKEDDNKQIFQSDLVLPYSITIKLHQQVAKVKQQSCQNIQINYYQQQITQMQEKINLLTKQNQVLNKKLKDYDKNIDEQIKKNIKEYKYTQNKLSQVISGLQVTIKEKLEQIDSLNNQLQYNQQILTDYDNKVDQNMNLKFQLSQLKETLQKQGNLQKLKQQKVIIQTNQKQKQYQPPINIQINKEQLNETLEVKQSLLIKQRFQQEQNKSFNLAKDVQNLQNIVTNLNQKIVLVEEEKKLAQEVFQEKSKQVEQKNKNINQLKNQISNLKTQLTEKKSQNYQVKKQIDSIKSLYQQTLKANLDLEKQKLCLIQQLKNKQQEVLLLKNDLQMINSKFEQKIGQSQSYLDREVKFAEKQKKMKQNIDILEEQSKKIFRLVQGKEQIQEIQIRKIQEQSIQIQKLLDRNYQLESLYSADSNYSQREQVKQTLSKQLEEQKQLNKNLKQQIQYMRKMLEQAMNNGKSDNNIDSIEQLKIHAQKLNDLNYELINSKANLQTLLADSQSKVVSLSAQISFIENEKDQLLKKISIYQKNIKMLQQQNQKITESKNSLQNKILSQNSSIYNQNKQMSILKSLINQKQSQIDILKQQIRKKDEDIQKMVQMEELINKKAKQILRLEEEIYSFHTNNNKKFEDIDQLREQNSILKQKVVQLQNTIMGQEIQILNLKENFQKQNIINTQRIKNTSLKQPKLHANQQDKNEPLKIQSLNATIQELSNQLNQLKFALALQESKNSDMKIQIKSIKQQNNKRIEQLNQKYIQLEKVSKTYKQQIQIIAVDDQMASNRLNIQHFSQANFKTVLEEIKNLLDTRINRQEQAAVIQRLNGNKLLLQNKIQSITHDRGVIQQKTKLLSMEFAKLKLNIIKTLKNYQEKSLMLSNIKPCEKIISEVIQISETLSNIHIIPQIYDI